ncbi:MAG TPA: DUF4097 family beta strand repeat-containing protein [Ornithinicoccus sp.]|nr:DUF4097 family beta strand repeat-containing protein [Ornithinicoccus sp.]
MMTRSTKKAVQVAGTVIAILIVLSLALPAMAEMLRHTDVQTHDLSAEVSVLEVTSDVGDIEVRVVAADEAPRAIATVESSFVTPEVRVDAATETATLAGRCPGIDWIQVCAVNWEVMVPADTSITLRSDVGDIRITAMAGEVTATSSVGDVVVAESASTSLSLHSSVGDVTLVSTVPPEKLRAASSTGDVRVSVPQDGATYDVTLDTSVGDLTNSLGSDPTSTRMVDLSSSVGDVTFQHAD